MPDLDVLEAALLRAIKRYLSPELASRAVRDAIKALDIPKDVPPPLAPPTELELRRIERIARRRGMVVLPKGSR